MSESNKGKKIPIKLKNEWSRTPYTCRICKNGNLYKNNYFIVSKEPIIRLYLCNKCGEIELKEQIEKDME